MEPITQTHPVSKKELWAGYVLSAVPVLMLFMSATMKLVRPPFVLQGFDHLGLPQRLVTGLGILELSCTIIYLIPRTSVLGAILVTGYLGGAILTHLRVGEPFIVQFAFGVLIWGGLYLRDPRLRALIPVKR
jgi:DoxX-like protein